MDAGPGILYPAQAVDGLVHQMCILFFNSELYFRHFVFFLLSTLGPQGWIVSQRSFIVGARSLNILKDIAVRDSMIQWATEN
jgi:hypothetical protein